MTARAEPGIGGKIFMNALAHTSGNFREQFKDCLCILGEKARNAGLGLANVIMQTFFIRAKDTGDYFKKKELGLSLLQEFYGSAFPGTSFVAQSPEDGKQVALDAILLLCPAECRIQHKNCDGIQYTLIQSSLFKEIYGAGFSASHRQSDTQGQYREAFEHLQKVLNKEDMDFSHIVRQWNYIEKFLKIRTGQDGPRQNYQRFNDVRADFYAQAEFPYGYPASTGIGMHTGGIVLECVAMKPSCDVFIAPLSNPLQKDAHAYSQEVLVGGGKLGLEKKTPLFERAKIIAHRNSGLIFISGTAAVRGQHTLPEKDIQSQTAATIENIKTLISAENILSAGVDIGRGSFSLSQLRAYVKRESDLPAVKKICTDHFGHVPSQFVIADICREALLVEIEGTAHVPIQEIQNHRGG